MKKYLAILLVLLLTLSALTACGKQNDTREPDAAAGGAGSGESGGDLTKLVVGASPTPHAEILSQVREALAEAGYELEIREFTDYVMPNTALEEGDLDANYF